MHRLEPGRISHFPNTLCRLFIASDREQDTLLVNTFKAVYDELAMVFPICRMQINRDAKSMLAYYQQFDFATEQQKLIRFLESDVLQKAMAICKAAPGVKESLNWRDYKTRTARVFSMKVNVDDAKRPLDIVLDDGYLGCLAFSLSIVQTFAEEVKHKNTQYIDSIAVMQGELESLVRAVGAINEEARSKMVASFSNKWKDNLAITQHYQPKPKKGAELTTFLTEDDVESGTLFINIQDELGLVNIMQPIPLTHLDFMKTYQESHEEREQRYLNFHQERRSNAPKPIVSNHVATLFREQPLVGVGATICVGLVGYFLLSQY